MGLRKSLQASVEDFERRLVEEEPALADELREIAQEQASTSAGQNRKGPEHPRPSPGGKSVSLPAPVKSRLPRGAARAASIAGILKDESVLAFSASRPRRAELTLLERLESGRFWPGPLTVLGVCWREKRKVGDPSLALLWAKYWLQVRVQSRKKEQYTPFDKRKVQSAGISGLDV